MQPTFYVYAVITTRLSTDILFVRAVQSTLKLDNSVGSFGRLFIFFPHRDCGTHPEYKFWDPGATHKKLYRCLSTGLFYSS